MGDTVSVTGVLTHYAPHLKNQAVFAVFCGVVSLMVLVIDLCIAKLGHRRSLLGIRYELNNALVAACLWTLGATFVGFLGAFAGFFQDTPQMIVAIGITWPVLFTRWVKSNDGDNGKGDSDTDSDSSSDREED